MPPTNFLQHAELRPRNGKPEAIIYDVGMHNGDDTAYYLHCGHRVVSIEANPLLCRAAEKRFSREIAEGQVSVLNVGVSDMRRTAEFFVNNKRDEWSSFDRELGTRQGTTATTVTVPCQPLSEIIATYGNPYYVKIDIEGYDRICLESLTPRTRPLYISVEVTFTPEVIDILESLGYDQFKLVNQGTYTDSLPIFDDEKVLRLVRKTSRLVPAIRPLLRPLARHDFDTFTQSFDWRFPEGCSGPFGSQTFGSWRSADQIRQKITSARHAFERRGKLANYWYDVHAKASG